MDILKILTLVFEKKGQVLNFIKDIFWVYLADHMAFLLCIEVMNYIQYFLF